MPENEGGDAGGGSAWSSIGRMVLMYMVVSNFVGKPSSAPPPQPADTAAVQGGSSGAAAVARRAAHGGGGQGDIVPSPPMPTSPIMNAWPQRQLMDLRVYVTEDAEFSAFDDASALVWHESSIGYGRDEAMQSTRERNITVSPSRRVLRNETSLWAHIFLSQSGTSPDPAARGHRPLSTVSAHHPLVRIVDRKKPKATRNLLSGEDLSEVELAEREMAPEIEFIPHWKPALTISIVEDFTAYPPNGVPPQIRPSLKVDVASSRYMPVLFINE